jgi:hypothetical protein
MAITVSGTTITFNDGTTQTTAASDADYIGAGFQLFTASGTFTVPTGITTIKVSVRAGGGGGGAGNIICCVAYNGGNGGFGGSSQGFLTVTPGATFTVTVGAGGAGTNTTGANGSAGGASSFATNFTTTGGGGGLGSTTFANGADGTGSGTTLNLMLPPPESVYRTRATSSTAAVAYALGNNTRYPGGAGQGEVSLSGGNAGGGIGGAVLVEW